MRQGLCKVVPEHSRCSNSNYEKSECMNTGICGLLTDSSPLYSTSFAWVTYCHVLNNTQLFHVWGPFQNIRVFGYTLEGIKCLKATLNRLIIKTHNYYCSTTKAHSVWLSIQSCWIIRLFTMQTLLVTYFSAATLLPLQRLKMPVTCFPRLLQVRHPTLLSPGKCNVRDT